MLKINFKNFDVQFIKELRSNWVNDQEWEFHFQESLNTVGCPLDIRVNGKRITLPDSEFLDYIVPDTLRNINNAFYFLLIKGEATAVFNRPDYLRMKLVGREVLLSNEKVIRPDLQTIIKDEPVDLKQTVKEVIRARYEYWWICDRAAELIKPNAKKDFMRICFLEKDLVESDLMDNQNSYFWLDLPKAWENYQRDHNLT